MGENKGEAETKKRGGGESLKGKNGEEKIEIKGKVVKKEKEGKK